MGMSMGVTDFSWPQKLEPQADLHRRRARDTRNHRIHADNRARSDTPDLVLLIQHVPHIGHHVVLGSGDVVPLDPGVQQCIASNLGVWIQRADPVRGTFTLAARFE